MCEQCLVNPLFYGEVLPGWFLIRARRESSSMKVGDWGLLRCNDPDFIWSSHPVLDLSSDDEEENLSIPEDDFTSAFRCDPNTGYALVKAAEQSGYHPEEGGLLYWLWEYLAKFIENTNPSTEEDPFPHLDHTQAHDYAL
jgi:hypothetical protein